MLFFLIELGTFIF